MSSGKFSLCQPHSLPRSLSLCHFALFPIMISTIKSTTKKKEVIMFDEWRTHTHIHAHKGKQTNKMPFDEKRIYLLCLSVGFSFSPPWSLSLSCSLTLAPSSFLSVASAHTLAHLPHSGSDDVYLFVCEFIQHITLQQPSSGSSLIRFFFVYVKTLRFSLT